MTWGRFERFVLDGPPSGSLIVLALMFWPWTFTVIVYLAAAAVRDWWIGAKV